MPSMALTPRNGMLPWRDAPVRLHLEPVDAAVADADPVDVERLGDDHVVGPVLAGDAPCSASQATPAKPPLSSSTVPLTSMVPGRSHAGAPQRLGRVDRRGDARPSCRRRRGRRSGRRGRRRRTDPPSSRRRPAPRRSGRSGAPAGAALRPARRPITLTRGYAPVCSGRPSAVDILDVEAASARGVADEAARTVLVVLARRVHRRDADQVGGEVDDLVGRVVDALGTRRSTSELRATRLHLGSNPRARGPATRRHHESLRAPNALGSNTADLLTSTGPSPAHEVIRCEPPLHCSGRFAAPRPAGGHRCRDPHRAVVGSDLAGPDSRGLDRRRGPQGRLVHAHRAADRLHRDPRRRRRRGRRRVAARRRARHARDRSARPAQPGRQGQRGRALGRQRVRPRRGHRRGALARGAQHRLGRAHRQGADRAGRDPLRPAGGRQPEDPSDRRLRLPAAAAATDGAGAGGHVGAGAGATVGKCWRPEPRR